MSVLDNIERIQYKKDDVYYKPTDHGFEKTIQERQKARKEGKNFNIEEDKKWEK